MKRSILATGIALIGLSLAACGGSDDGDKAAGGSSTADYCKQLKAAQSTFGEATSSVSIKDSIKAFHSLADAAPSAVASDWKVLDGAFVKLENALNKAKVDLSDSAAVQKALTSGKVPISVIQNLTDAKLTEAQSAIEKHAKTACDFDFGN